MTHQPLGWPSILAVAAIIVAVIRWKWIPVLGLVVSVVTGVIAVAIAARTRQTAPITQL